DRRRTRRPESDQRWGWATGVRGTKGGGLTRSSASRSTPRISAPTGDDIECIGVDGGLGDRPGRECGRRPEGEDGAGAHAGDADGADRPGEGDGDRLMPPPRLPGRQESPECDPEGRREALPSGRSLPIPLAVAPRDTERRLDPRGGRVV